MEWNQKSIIELQSALNANIVTSEELVLHYIKRIVDIDQGSPRYNSVFTINPDALSIAKQLDTERKNGTVRGVMHGIPVLLKDNINTGDKQRTTAGANILRDHYAIEDASITSTLRKNGAIILGKTNLTELACFKSFDTVNGFSSLSGYVLCPWNIEEDPSGSSTGSAISVALRLAPVAIGTETGGSIMSPSMKNGVVGLKPTIGFVSRKGIVPISSTLDTAGPMGRTVVDVATLLSAIRNNDIDDPITLTKQNEFVDYTTYLHSSSISKMRIGINKDGYNNLSSERQLHFDKVCHTIESLGGTIVNVSDVPQVKRIFHIMKYEFKSNINKYLHDEGLGLTLRDIVYFNEADPTANLKYGQKVLKDVLYHTSGTQTENEYIDALEERSLATKAMEEIFKDKKLDMIYFASYTSIGPECGFPTLSLPIGLDEERMPIGTYFLAPKWKEQTLLQVGYAIEQRMGLTFDPLKKR